MIYMRRKVALVALGLALAATAGGFALADTGPDGSDDVGEHVAVPDYKGYDEGADAAAGDEAGFVGLTKEEAIALANEQDRLWRIGREDADEFAFDAQLLVGRVTFELDAGIVTTASIESDVAPPTVDWGPVDTDRLDIVVAGLDRLATVDNTFGGGNVFTDMRVATTIGADPDRPLHPLELEMIAAALQSRTATVTFINDAGAEIDSLFGESPSGVAILSVDDVRIDADRAELDLQMWCGSLCGSFLTYELVPAEGGWQVLGTIGPIAVS
jgi:hypothetical protein